MADPNRPHGDLGLETAEAMADSGVYGAREKLLVTADRGIVRAGERTLRALGELRDAARHGAATRSVAFHDAYHRYAEAVWALRRAARTDLGNAPINPADVGKPSWDAKENCAFCRAYARQPEPVPRP